MLSNDHRENASLWKQEKCMGALNRHFGAGIASLHTAVEVKTPNVLDLPGEKAPPGFGL